MQRSRLLPILIASLALALPSLASAQVQNGDFEMGGNGWVVDPVPARWRVDFPPTGGNPDGHAAIRSPFGDSMGEACIRQSFQCGTPGLDSCLIQLQYTLLALDAGPFTGRVRVIVDGVERYVSPPAKADLPWTPVALMAACGPHTIVLCLQVDGGNHGWEARFDNVSADCIGVVSNRRHSWGTLKLLYR